MYATTIDGKQKSYTFSFGSKNFVYLVQTPKCLPWHWLTPNYIGEETRCNCDVIVLSFQEECKTSPLSHVEYVHHNNTTWNQGRNLLWLQAKKRAREYNYYIFLDDDVRLTFSRNFPDFKPNTTSPLREFENFLTNYEPVIGVTDFPPNHGFNSMLARRKAFCNNIGSSKPLYLSVHFFDALFNAFHSKALDYLLPYTTTYDNMSWWYSQREIIARMEIIFRGQAVMFAPIQSSNWQHRPYPRRDGPARQLRQIWVSIVRKIAKTIPLKYRGEKLLKDFETNPFHYKASSKTVCLNLPPRFSIVPFQHFSWFNEKGQICPCSSEFA